jgi:hypothetical protein
MLDTLVQGLLFTPEGDAAQGAAYRGQQDLTEESGMVRHPPNAQQSVSPGGFLFPASAPLKEETK